MVVNVVIVQRLEITELGGWRVLLRKHQCLKDIGSWVYEEIHRSEMTWMKYFGGSGSNTGTMNLMGPVFILAELLFEEEELVVEDHLAVHVLQEDP